MITQERLKELLRYEEDTGKFYWNVSVGRVKLGDEAGTLESDGYIRIQIDGKRYQAHRLAWMYIYGTFPEQFIDHINGDKADNRLCNLREANSSQNNHNRKINSNNSSGVKGLSKQLSGGYVYWYGTVKVKDLPRENKTFPYTDEGKQAAIKWLEETRAKLHGNFTNHG